MVLQPNVHCPLGGIYAVNTIRKIMDLRDKDKLFILIKTCAAYILGPQQTNTFHKWSFLFHRKKQLFHIILLSTVIECNKGKGSMPTHLLFPLPVVLPSST